MGPLGGVRIVNLTSVVSGLADPQVRADGGPSLVHSIIRDKVAGLAAAQAVCAALVQRGRDGRGRRVSLSMLEVMLAFNWPDVMWNETFRSPDFQPGLAVSDTYRLWKTADGAVAVIFITGGAFADWCSALDAPPQIRAETFATEMESRYRWRELWPLWEARLAALSTDEAVRRFHAAGVPAGPYLRRDQLADDPQVRSRAAIAEIDDPDHGPTRLPAAPVRFDDSPRPLPAPAPRSASIPGRCSPRLAVMRRRLWIRRAERDSGCGASGATGDVAERLKALERENRELRQANEILRLSASADRSRAEGSSTTATAACSTSRSNAPSAWPRQA